MSIPKKKLGELCMIEKGKVGIQKAIPGEYPLVVTAEERLSHNEYHFEGNAVVIPLVSSTGHGHKSLKRIHFQTGKFAVGNILCAVLPKDETVLNAEYLYRFLDLNREKELVGRMKGMANVSLPLKEIAQIEIPLPPVAEQIKFVEEYEQLEVGKNKLDTELAHQLDMVKQLRKAFLREAMRGKLTEDWRTSHLELVSESNSTNQLLAKIKAGKERLIKEGKLKKEKPLPPVKDYEIPFEIPESWIWRRLNEIVEIAGGGTPSKGRSDYWNGDIPWVSPKDMKELNISDTKLKITEKGVQNSSTKIIPEGSLLVVGRSGILKRMIPVAINAVPCTVNQDMKVLMPFLKQTNRFLQYLLLGLENILLSEYVKFGMTVHSLKYTEFEEMPIPLPPISEQQQIVTKLDELMQYCDQLEESIKTSQRQNEMLLQQVLREALEPEKALSEI